MLPDFLGMVERWFCWVFCKKRWFGCGFKRGKRGLVVVDLWLVFYSGRSEVGFFASLRMTGKSKSKSKSKSNSNSNSNGNRLVATASPALRPSAERKGPREIGLTRG